MKGIVFAADLGDLRLPRWKSLTKYLYTSRPVSHCDMWYFKIFKKLTIAMNHRASQIELRTRG